MGKKLISHVTVHDSDFVAHTFAPGDKVPGWAKKIITNPNVWGEGDGDDSGDDVTTPPAAPAGPDAPATPAASDPAVGETTETLTVPPTTGAGSGTDVWRDYAVKATATAGLQLDIADDAKRGDIIEALKGAGIATE